MQLSVEKRERKGDELRKTRKTQQIAFSEKAHKGIMTHPAPHLAHLLAGLTLQDCQALP